MGTARSDGSELERPPAERVVLGAVDRSPPELPPLELPPRVTAVPPEELPPLLRCRAWARSDGRVGALTYSRPLEGLLDGALPELTDPPLELEPPLEPLDTDPPPPPPPLSRETALPDEAFPPAER